jgi:Ca2+-binding RTX toxin-like protein
LWQAAFQPRSSRFPARTHRRLHGRGGNDDLEGGSGADRLFGNAGNDDLEGGSGRDRLLGGSGSDELDGDDGNDRLNGGDGRNRLDGGEGDDRLTGGADIFEFEDDDDGRDIITDWGRGNDRIDLDDFDFGSVDEVLDRGTQVGDDVVFGFGSGVSVRILDVELAAFDASDFML